MGETLGKPIKDIARERIKKVFSYIRELTKLRTPPASQLESYDWSLRFSNLPTFPTIQTFAIPDEDQVEFDGVILRVRRPVETPCPAPPASIVEWVENGWEKAEISPNFVSAINHLNEDGTTVTEQFSESEERVETYREWFEKRRLWQLAEKPVREAATVFSDFFKLQGQIQRESEKFQLYLGDGHLVWQSAIEPVDHPILLKKVELEFDSSVPEFVLRESDDSPELYTALLRHHELDGNGLLDCKNQLEQNEPHPLANGKTAEFLKFFVQRFFQDGRFFDSKNQVNHSVPSVYRDPVIFLGSRAQGFSDALDKLIDAMPTLELIPEALMRIVGLDAKVDPATGLQTDSNGTKELAQTERTVDFLLTKPANSEQERVITRLEQTGSVLVQGPPGTGKSHTIANIIGHLLASGKTVLVSSHTSKALRVVREKVVKPLQPLCVSVLENDMASKSQLAESINGIVSYLSSTDEQSLSKEIDQLGSRRAYVQGQLKQLEEEALQIRKGEYADIIVAGVGVPPSEAARRVCAHELTHGWIPSPMTFGAPLPLSVAELQELYATNAVLTAEDEQCFGESLPDLQSILNPSELCELASSLESLDRTYASRFGDLWQNDLQDAQALSVLTGQLTKALEIFAAHQWIHKVVEDSKIGKERLQVWLTLMGLIDETIREVANRAEAILRHGPQVEIDSSPDVINACTEIVVHLKSGKSLSYFSLALRSSWKSVIKASKVDDGNPTKLEHFQAILAHLETLQLRRELQRRWERQVVALGGPMLDLKQPEISAQPILAALRMATNWTSTAWKNIEVELTKQGFDLLRATEKIAVSTDAVGHIQHIQLLVETILIPAIESRTVWLRLKQLESLRESSLRVLRLNAQKPANVAAYLQDLTNSVTTLDLEAYEAGYNRYLDLVAKSETFGRRRGLLEKLGRTAPAWAKSVELRSGVHGQSVLPGDSAAAWNICQWRQELDKRTAQDYSTVQRELQRLKIELNSVNAQYVEKLAWIPARKGWPSRTASSNRLAATTKEDHEIWEGRA
mgnify:CR=1 FL=1